MDLTDTLQQAASSDWANYRAQPVIGAVNTLLPLGSGGALNAVEDYLTTRDLDADPQEGLLLVLRVLFEVPTDPGYHPPVRLGGTSPPPPADPRSLPLFPLVLVVDVPLLIVSGFALAGDVEPVSAHVDYFRQHGTIRSGPLKPSGSPSTVLDGFRNIYREAYGRLPSAEEDEHILSQVS